MKKAKKKKIKSKLLEQLLEKIPKLLKSEQRISVGLVYINKYI